MSRLRVGLTGGVASGKSSVSRILHELGAVVIDADVLAREVVEPGTEGLRRIVEEFGHDVLDERGSLDRPRVAARVFADRDARGRLEAIIHPLVRERAARLEASSPPDAVVVHDIPLLVETGQASSFDAVVVVDASEEDQMARMVEFRGMIPADARARIAAQASREERRAVATHVIDNTGSLEDLRDRVTEVFDELTKLR